jgi:hypothetical protein
MHLFRSIATTLVLALTLYGGLASCGGSTANIDARTTTLGQELQDLDQAREQGLLSEKEYKQKRKAIMKRY